MCCNHSCGCTKTRVFIPQSPNENPPTDFTYYVVTDESVVWFDSGEHANTTYVEPDPEVSECVEGIENPPQEEENEEEC